MKDTIREIVSNYAHINQNLKKLCDSSDLKEDDKKPLRLLIESQNKLISILSRNL
jgi:hypothetical protein